MRAISTCRHVELERCCRAATMQGLEVRPSIYVSLQGPLYGTEDAGELTESLSHVQCAAEREQRHIIRSLVAAEGGEIVAARGHKRCGARHRRAGDYLP